MTEVIVAHEKHGTFTYATALGLLQQRINDDYWYSGEDELAARDAVMQGEDAAWFFLDSRRDHEYEYVEKQTVK